MGKKRGLGSMVDLISYKNRKKMGFGANGGFDFTKETREFLRKKMGFGANGGFDFTKELKEILRKKKGFGAKGGFGGTKEKRELIVKNYEKIEGIWAQRWI